MGARDIMVEQAIIEVLAPIMDINHHFMVHKDFMVDIDIPVTDIPAIDTAADIGTLVVGAKEEGMGISTAGIVEGDIDILAVGTVEEAIGAAVITVDAMLLVLH